jgi:hypothetical protein
MLDHLPRLDVVIVVDALDTAECSGDPEAADRVRMLEAALRRMYERKGALLVFTVANDDSMVGRWPDS